MATRSNLLGDFLYFVKNDLINNVNDPRSGDRGNSQFVMTSYPQRDVKYPIITLKVSNIEALRAGMQVSTMDITIVLEVRIWARSEKEKDDIYTDVLDRLADIQFTSGGSVANDFHDFNILSSVEVDDDGTGGTKSRILQCQYKFYNQ